MIRFVKRHTYQTLWTNKKLFFRRPANKMTERLHCAMDGEKEPEILAEELGIVGRMTLNRPKALNALTCSMVEDMAAILREWESKPSIGVVLLKGSGDRAFCAGGDVKAVVQLGRKGDYETALRFFRSEYQLNYSIASLSKPYVALIDGITMGGGAGVSIHGKYRVATEKTVFAMPECAIGLMPDIGASYFLTRLLRPPLGLYLALTGARLKGIDVMHAGLATHYVPTHLLGRLEKAVLGLDIGAHSLPKLLSEHQEMESLPAGSLSADTMQQIESLFGGKSSVEEIYEACKASGTEFAQQTLEMMQKGSPTSQRIVFKQLQEGRNLPLDECLRMEYRIVHHLVLNANSDFYSGVDAALISKTGSPVWNPSRLNDVTNEQVNTLFQHLPPHEELQLSLDTQAKGPKL